MIGHGVVGAKSGMGVAPLGDFGIRHGVWLSGGNWRFSAHNIQEEGIGK